MIFDIQLYELVHLIVEKSTWKSIWSGWMFSTWLFHRLPFNWKTSHGYLLALFLESLASFTVGSIIVPPFCFLIGSCFLITAFVHDIVVKMHYLDVHRRSDGKNKAIKHHLCNIICDISDAKQFSKNDSLFTHICGYKDIIALKPENDTHFWRHEI